MERAFERKAARNAAVWVPVLSWGAPTKAKGSTANHPRRSHETSEFGANDGSEQDGNIEGAASKNMTPKKELKASNEAPALKIAQPTSRETSVVTLDNEDDGANVHSLRKEGVLRQRPLILKQAFRLRVQNRRERLPTQSDRRMGTWPISETLVSEEKVVSTTICAILCRLCGKRMLRYTLPALQKTLLAQRVCLK